MVPKEKEFVIRHVFPARSLKKVYGPIETRYNIPWFLRVREELNCHGFYLHCEEVENGKPGWFIDFDYEMKLVGKRKSFGTKGSDRFDENNCNNTICPLLWSKVKQYIVNDKLKVEWHVKINRMEGFDDPQGSGAAQDDSAVLVVAKEKFDVDKKFLADNCTYFNTLFFETSDAGGKPEFEIKDCKNSEDFQNFLKILKGEQEIDDKSINGVLELSTKFGSQSMLTKCEEFLMKKSKKSIQIKLNFAVEHKLNKLKKKCLSDIKTKKDLAEIATENANKLNASVWKELLKKAITIN
ncbi:hypothetical protein B9Z55_009186 [Caenorhabditis nigoni]|uniref:BTB domain-containing protein n=1 Tax=Caenorhabditis nigoni TaxID=1611254 RepID=A0A2G5UR13_9PELO|nr:hypothetical protein B9Z55_009186 [Caenorhabditis nigoni]